MINIFLTKVPGLLKQKNKNLFNYDAKTIRDLQEEITSLHNSYNI